MMTTNLMSVAANNDAELVGGTLAGNRDAFSQIVSRYQSLICSLAYSATGSLGQSEDLAQETFITAWKQLAGLREPEKLRAWLCGIAKILINNSLRKHGREPSHRAESLEEISESHSPGPLPVEQTISNEEQAILWRSLEKIPEIYREPLVLFYREHQSIAAVAQSLELTEDTVRQRLSRGRKLLHEQVLAFVEGALEKTSPGKMFTAGVIAALPLAATTAKAASVGAALAKGVAAAKGVATIGTVGGLLAMLGGAYVSFKAHVDDAKSPRERQFMTRWFGKRMLLSLAVFAPFFVAVQFDYFRTPIAGQFLAATGLFVLCGYGILTFAYHSRCRQQIQIEDNTYDKSEWTMPRKITDGLTAPADVKANRSKAIRFMALGIGMVIFVVVSESWKQNLWHAILMTLFMSAGLIRGFQQWQNYPRFQSIRLAWFVILPMIMGLLTLFVFNFRQYEARAGADLSRIASPGLVFSFNLVVILAYVALVGLLVWKRKASLPSRPIK